MKKGIILLSFALCASFTALAQVHVEQDAQIGKIVGGKKQQQSQTAQPAKPAPQSAAAPKPTAPKPTKNNPVATEPRPATTAPARQQTQTAPSNNAVGRLPRRRGPYTPRQRYNGQGYRVQVFTGGNKRKDRLEAQKMQKKCKETFPELAAYVHFVSPHWVCRIGDFRRREDAQRYVKKANSKLTFEARIVRSNIFIAR
ncbi:MAG: SPOR domain-containing protein [Alloprevotella sp.]|nr:SPOR domain-containing protein [Alloprevotella sp.]